MVVKTKKEGKTIHTRLPSHSCFPPYPTFYPPTLLEIKGVKVIDTTRVEKLASTN